MAVHRASASTAVDSILAEAVSGHAKEQAGLETQIRHEVLGPLIDRLEADAAGQGMVVRDLLNVLVLPAVNLELAAEAAAQAERHYAAAAADGLRSALLAAGQAVVDMAGMPEMRDSASQTGSRGGGRA